MVPKVITGVFGCSSKSTSNSLKSLQKGFLKAPSVSIRTDPSHRYTLEDSRILKVWYFVVGVGEGFDGHLQQ